MPLKLLVADASGIKKWLIIASEPETRDTRRHSVEQRSRGRGWKWRDGEGAPWVVFQGLSLDLI